MRQHPVAVGDQRGGKLRDRAQPHHARQLLVVVIDREVDVEAVVRRRWNVIIEPAFEIDDRVDPMRRERIPALDGRRDEQLAVIVDLIDVHGGRSLPEVGLIARAVRR